VLTDLAEKSDQRGNAGEQAEELSDCAGPEAPIAESRGFLGQWDDVGRDTERFRGGNQRALAKGEQLNVDLARVTPK